MIPDKWNKVRKRSNKDKRARSNRLKNDKMLCNRIKKKQLCSARREERTKKSKQLQYKQFWSVNLVKGYFVVANPNSNR